MASSNPPSGKKQPIDPLLQQRLSELGNRRGGAPLPPPQPGQQPAGRSGQQKPSGQQKVSGQQARPAAKQPAARQGNAGASRVIDTTPDPRTPRTPPRSSQSNRPAAPARPGANARPGTAPRPGKRVKPARSAKMAALAVSVVSTAALAVYFANQGSPSQAITLTGGTLAGTANNTKATKTTKTTKTTTATTVASGGTTQNTTQNTTAPKATTAAKTVKDGTYTGGVSQNRWGNVQVAAVYKGGQLVDVQVLQYPDSHDRSVAINQYALPILINDSLGSQSANINNISGATYTSQSYAQSLQSAIDAAKSASGITG
jgi:uncharacterized protein with FMN-binding domain